MVSQKSLFCQREISPQKVKVLLQQQLKFTAKKLSLLFLSLNRFKVGMVDCRRGLTVRQPNSCHSSLISIMHPNPYSPKQTSQRSNNSSGFCPKKMEISFLSCSCRCFCNYYPKEQSVAHPGEILVSVVTTGLSKADCQIGGVLLPRGDNQGTLWISLKLLPTTQSLQPPPQILINKQQCIYVFKMLFWEGGPRHHQKFKKSRVQKKVKNPCQLFLRQLWLSEEYLSTCVSKLDYYI